MIQLAIKKGINAEIQDVTNIQEASGSYDAVICLGNSLGGIFDKIDRIKAIKEMTRVSRKYVIIDCNNRLGDPIVWIPKWFKKKIGLYHYGEKLGIDVVSGLRYGDIVWYDRSVDCVLYHYIYSVLELKKEMKKCGLKVKILPHIYSKKTICMGLRK